MSQGDGCQKAPWQWVRIPQAPWLEYALQKSDRAKKFSRLFQTFPTPPPRRSTSGVPFNTSSAQSDRKIKCVEWAGCCHPGRNAGCCADQLWKSGQQIFFENKKKVRRTHLWKVYAVGQAQVFNAQIQLQAVSENVLSDRILASGMLTAR